MAFYREWQTVWKWLLRNWPTDSMVAAVLKLGCRGRYNPHYRTYFIKHLHFVTRPCSWGDWVQKINAWIHRQPGRLTWLVALAVANHSHRVCYHVLLVWEKTWCISTVHFFLFQSIKFHSVQPSITQPQWALQSAHDLYVDPWFDEGKNPPQKEKKNPWPRTCRF